MNGFSPSTRVTSGSTWTDYLYDAAGQLQELRDQTNTLLVDLDYDANGNRIAANGDAYTYDWANRLTEATVGSTTVLTLAIVPRGSGSLPNIAALPEGSSAMVMANELA